MALSTEYNVVRTDIGAVQGGPLGTDQTRGLIVGDMQSEVVMVTKLTGDTTGSVDLSFIQRPVYAFVLVINDNLGALVTTKTLTQVTFTHTDLDTIALSGLGNWTNALLFVLGRGFD